MSLTHIKVRSQNSFHVDVTREIASLEGHLFALPLIFINFGGEMIYVIEHRLKAQKLEDRMDKGKFDYSCSRITVYVEYSSNIC